MRVFILASYCPHFREVDPALLYSMGRFAYEHEISEPQITRWYQAGILKANSDHITAWLELWQFLNKPDEFDVWCKRIAEALPRESAR